MLRPGPHVTTRGKQQTAGRHPSPRPRPASQKMNEILILSSLCKLLYSTTFPNFLKLLRFHSKHSILKILNTRSTGATAPPEDTYCILATFSGDSKPHKDMDLRSYTPPCPLFKVPSSSLQGPSHNSPHSPFQRNSF